jgi:hypothetical protein
MKTLALALTLAAFASAQVPTKQSSAENGYLVAPLIFRDAGCGLDYLKAQSTEGIERGKMMDELVRYGCVEKPRAIYKATVAERRTIRAPGGKAAVFLRVQCLMDVRRTQMMGGPITPLTRSAWVLDADLLRITDQELSDMTAKAVAERDNKP